MCPRVSSTFACLDDFNPMCRSRECHYSHWRLEVHSFGVDLSSEPTSDVNEFSVDLVQGWGPGARRCGLGGASQGAALSTRPLAPSPGPLGAKLHRNTYLSGKMIYFHVRVRENALFLELLAIFEPPRPPGGVDLS